MLESRIREKFGADVLETVLQVTHRHVDDDGVELSASDRKADYLARLAQASDRARWVCAADKLHNAASLVADLRRTLEPDSVWGRFKLGKGGTVRWYRDVYDRLLALGFQPPIMRELDAVVTQLEALGRQ